MYIWELVYVLGFTAVAVSFAFRLCMYRIRLAAGNDKQSLDQIVNRYRIWLLGMAVTGFAYHSLIY